MHVFFGDKNFLTSCVMKNFFARFLFTHFCVFRKQGLFKFHLTWLGIFFFVIKTVHHTFVTTFFECEMSILYKEYISELKIVESRIRTDKKI